MTCIYGWIKKLGIGKLMEIGYIVVISQRREQNLVFFWGGSDLINWLNWNLMAYQLPKSHLKPEMYFLQTWLVFGNRVKMTCLRKFYQKIVVLDSFDGLRLVRCFFCVLFFFLFSYRGQFLWWNCYSSCFWKDFFKLSDLYLFQVWLS